MTANDQTPRPIALGQYAGFITRLIAWLIDSLIVAGVITVVAAIIGFVEQAFGINDWLGLGEHTSLLLVIIAGVVGLSIYLFYYLGSWMLAGQTLGKALMGVRIVRTDGNRLKMGNCVRRLAGYWISAILFWGYLLVLIDSRRQAGHDKFAGTFVVYSWPETSEGSKPIRDRVRQHREKRKAAQAAADKDESSQAA